MSEDARRTDVCRIDACRLDIWLWRARFFKSRSLAGRFIDEGRVRVTRSGRQTRIDKPGHAVKPQDSLVFALSGRVFEVRIIGLGERRGPATEARLLYDTLSSPASAGERLS